MSSHRDDYFLPVQRRVTRYDVITAGNIYKSPLKLCDYAKPIDNEHEATNGLENTFKLSQTGHRTRTNVH